MLWEPDFNDPKVTDSQNLLDCLYGSDYSVLVRVKEAVPVTAGK